MNYAIHSLSKLTCYYVASFLLGGLKNLFFLNVIVLTTLLIRKWMAVTGGQQQNVAVSLGGWGGLQKRIMTTTS